MEGKIHKLAELFARFPGTGSRQSKRFVYFLLTQQQSYIDELISEIADIRKSVRNCTNCQRFHAGRNTSCDICNDPNRQTNRLLVVEKDTDLENIERTGLFDGAYFVLGGTVPILSESPETKVRVAPLLKRIASLGAKENHSLEVILAFSASPEGEHTAEFVRGYVKKNIKKPPPITELGRGLSTGLELEYSDAETIKSAIKNRA